MTMLRALIVMLLAAAGLAAATIKLYLKDGTYQLVREYQVQGERVRYYSTERSEWEEIPASLVDLKRTQAENAAHVEKQKQEAAELAAEEAVERAEREERESVPMNAGVFFLAGGEMKELKPAESKVVSNRRRSVLKVLTPIPVVSGKATLELDGEHAATEMRSPRPEFYIRLSAEEPFAMVKLEPKKDARVVQHWTVVPVTKEIVQEQSEVEVFRRQLADGLYKMWPMKPLEPGEYAIVQFTQGKGEVQVWDFSYRPGARHAP